MSQSNEYGSLDGHVTAYIRGLRFRRKLMGADEKEIWTVAANLQKYYREQAEAGARCIGVGAREESVRSTILLRKRLLETRQEWMRFLGHLLLLVAIGGIVFHFLLGVETVRGNAMYPALREGDLTVFLRVGNYGNEDVVLYNGGVGRIRGTEGTRVDRTEGGLMVLDGNLQPVQKRSGIFYETRLRNGDSLPCPSTVPRNSFLILGDNRKEARDSRVMGFIPKEALKGRVFMVIKRRSI